VGSIKALEDASLEEEKTYDIVRNKAMMSLIPIEAEDEYVKCGVVTCIG